MLFGKKNPQLPPGQSLVDKMPVLHEGSVPRIDLATWRFRIFGLVEQEITLSFNNLMQLPCKTYQNDIHCVTGWSKLKNSWEGIPMIELAGLFSPLPGASYVMVHAYGNWTTNLPYADLMRDNVFLATKYNGQELAPEHGWPLRLVVPHLYFWKSAKWVNGLELMEHNRPGFWEERGYHMYGDPWKEQRYRDDR